MADTLALFEGATLLCLAQIQTTISGVRTPLQEYSDLQKLNT
jgi:hypothetical protein